MAERQVLEDLILISFMHKGCARQFATAFCVFRLQQMAFASAGTQNFSSCSDLETLGHCLSRLNTFWSSHK